MWIESSTGKWHRIDPGNGRITACGTPIFADRWSFPTDKEPTGAHINICRYPECRGVANKEDA